MRIARVVILLFCTQLLLSACASMSESECSAANWELRGEDDAMSGKPRSYVNEHTKACAKYEIKPELVDYRVGWDRGIEDYCTRDNGWKVGVSGTSYEHTCPANLEAEFYQAYQLAVNVRLKRSAAATSKNELNEINRQLDEDELSDEKRSKLKKKRKRLKKDLAHAEAQSAIAIMEAQDKGFTVTQY